MLGQLRSRNPPVELTSWSFNRKKMTDLTPKLRAFCAETEEVRGYAQRAFTAYCKSVYLAKDKKTFNIVNYKLDKYAASLGLAKAPRLRFLERDRKVMTAMKSENISSDESDGEDMFERRKATIEVTESEDKKIELDLAEKEKSKTVSKAKLVTKAIRAKAAKNKIVFDDDGNQEDQEEESDDDFNIEDASARLRQADEEHDRQNEKETKKQKRLEKKRKEKEKKRAILDSRKPDKEGEPEEEEEIDGLLPETENFLANLTMPEGNDDIDSNEEYDYERDSGDDVTPAKRVKLESSDEEDDEDLEKLEAMAMAHL